MKHAVLIADDDPTIGEMMDIILTQAGFEVSLVNNGEAAIDLLKRARFSLVVLDVHMPRLDGLDVLKAMGRMAWFPPVLIVSANRLSETIREAAALGCSGYLAKPFTPDGLLKRACMVIAGRNRANVVLH